MTPAGMIRAVADALARAGADDDAVSRACACVEAALSDVAITGLTQRQARMVRVLAAARGRLLSPEAVLEAIGSDGERKLFDVYVCKVRRLRPDLGAHIKTVWGQGYVWTGPALSSIIGGDAA